MSAVAGGAAPRSARRVAYDALRRIEGDGAYANLVLPSMLAASGLSSADRRFVTDLVYGTTRRRRSCDALVDRFVTAPPDDATRTRPRPARELRARKGTVRSGYFLPPVFLVLVPYFDRLRARPSTPLASNVPRTMW